MAMIDYGAIYKRNGIRINNDLFMDMEKYTGFTVGKLKDVTNETVDINGKWFVYIGDKELLVCIYKTQVLIISNGEIIKHIYRLDDDNLCYNRYRLKFNINGVNFDIKRLNNKPQFKLRFWYKGNLHECIYGYNVEV